MNKENINHFCECGSKKFYVQEYNYYEADIDPDDNNTLNCYIKENGIDLILCANCKNDITNKFFETNSNLNFQ